MIKLLPFILIPILLVAGLGYWRYVSIKQNIAPVQKVDTQPIEVPKQLPNASVDDRVQNLENTISKLVTQVNALKAQPAAATTSNTQLNDIQASITDLKARVAALEKATPAPATTTSSSKSTIYIPLGSGGNVASTDWSSLNTFQVNLDPSQYPGYTSMQLEVNMRLNQPGGTLYARLYNSTSASAISSEISSTSTNSSIYTSSTFTLPAGSKTYLLQAKISDGSQAFLDNARIKVNF